MRGGETLDASLRKRSLSLARAERLGETVRRIHQCAASARFSIRGHGDKAFFAAKLNHKLGFGDNPVLHQLIAELSCQQPRQIILGDPSPKNIAIARDSDCFRFFDLEDVHRGNVVFDVGFLAGHFLLHTHDAPERAAQLVERFLRGYGHQVLDARLLKTTALGAVMYRLASPVVPYQTDLSTSMKREFLKAVEKVLGRGDLETLSWRNLVFHALAFQ